MNIDRARQALYRTLMFSGICGFEIAAGFTALTDVLSTPASIAVRLFVACCALIAILIDFGKALSGSRRLILGICIFWNLYIFRIIYATNVSGELLSFPDWYYYSWSIGACVLPMLGLSLWSPRLDDADRNFMTLFLALSFGGVLASFGASSIEIGQGNEQIETGRLQLAALNPILLGQLGATLVVMTVWVLVNRLHKHGLAAKILFFCTALIGCGLLIGSNSRGPLVSVMICLLFIAGFSVKRSRFYAYGMLIVAAIAFVPLTQYIESEFGFSTYSRLFEQSQFSEENTLDRLSRYDGAINAFMENPLFGASLEEPKHGGYPHNLFIEAVMTTGIFGGVLLVFLMASAFSYSIKIYTKAKSYGWASLLFIQFFVAAQFSGSIYTVNYLWITTGLVIAIHATLVSKRRISRLQNLPSRDISQGNLTRFIRSP